MRTFDHTKAQQAALREEAQQWLLRLTSGAATTEDAQAFRDWCDKSQAHLEAFASARRLWKNLGPAAEIFTRHERERALTGATTDAAPPMHLWSSMSDVAADFHTGTGEQRRVEVAPGIVIEMNTQTSINVRQYQGRVVGIDLLGGELQVKNAATAGNGFVVYAGGGKAVVGMQALCNIRCLDSNVQFTGLDGVSSVQYQGRSAIIGGAQRVNYGNGQLFATVAADTELTMAWRRRVLIFDGQPLSDVVEEINRYRPGRIVLANAQLASRKVQARLSLNQLADVANLIHDAYGASVTSLPGGIVVLS
jgi:transmembrane sensor